MGKQVERYLVPDNISEVDQIKLGLATLDRLCSQSVDTAEAVLLVPTKHQIQHTSLASVLGPNISKTLHKGNEVSLPCDMNLRLETVQTFRGSYKPYFVLAVYASKKMLDKIDSAVNITAMIIVLGLKSDIEQWKRTWNPQVVGEPPTSPEKLIDNPVVEEAMIALTSSINISTGLVHPRDKSSAVQLLRELHKHGELFDPNSLSSWALRNGWTPEGADDLNKIAQAILDHRPIRGGGIHHWRPDIIEYLKQRVNERLM